MKVKAIILCVALVMIAGLGTGCSKKRIESNPATPATAKRVDDQRLKDQQAREEQARLEEERRLQEQAIQDEKAKEAKKAFDDAVVELGNIIHFDFDSFEIKEQYRPLLESKAELLKKYTNVSMVVEGYCDSRGTEEYNLALGERRARAVYEYLILLGVAPERLSIVSFGEENPIDKGNNETAWSMNRRAQFRLAY